MNKILTLTILLLLPLLLLAGEIEPSSKQATKAASGVATKSHENASEKASVALTGPTINSGSYTMKMNTGVIAMMEMSSGGSHSLIGSINLPVVVVTTMSPLDNELEEPVVTQYALHQNYPNPFNPTTEIRFDLPENVKVELRIYNTLGQLVTTLMNETRMPGAYRILWDGRSFEGKEVGAGVYFYQLKAGSFVDTKQMVLLK